MKRIRLECSGHNHSSTPPPHHKFADSPALWLSSGWCTFHPGIIVIPQRSGGICFSGLPHSPVPAALDFSEAAYKPRYSNDMLVLISVLVAIAALFGWMSARVLRLPNTIGTMLLTALTSVAL